MISLLSFLEVIFLKLAGKWVRQKQSQRGYHLMKCADVMIALNIGGTPIPKAITCLIHGLGRQFSIQIWSYLIGQSQCGQCQIVFHRKLPKQSCFILSSTLLDVGAEGASAVGTTLVLPPLTSQQWRGVTLPEKPFGCITVRGIILKWIISPVISSSLTT